MQKKFLILTLFLFSTLFAFQPAEGSVRASVTDGTPCENQAHEAYMQTYYTVYWQVYNSNIQGGDPFLADAVAEYSARRAETNTYEMCMAFGIFPE